MSETECSNSLSEDWVVVPEALSSPQSIDQIMESTSQAPTLTLSDNWEWKQKPKDEPDVEALNGHDGWRKTSIPSEIFTDLLDEGEIPDPHIGQNENDVQWVAKADWLYRTRFRLKTMPKEWEKAVLAFYGLDTYADVYFNTTLILSSEVNFPSN
jgi:beta-mannosidase